MRIPVLAALLTLIACHPGSAHEFEGGSRSGPYSVEALDEWGAPLPTYLHGGRAYVLGQHGQRYTLRVRNNSPRRVEAVAAVDGRDVLDGKPSDLAKRGYLVDAYGEVTIDGFRLSQSAVAAFRFGSVRDSYAAQMGEARDVGVVGVAIFRERVPRYLPPPPPFQPREQAGDRLESAPAPSASASPSENRGMAKKSRSAPLDAPSAPGGMRAQAREDRPGLGTEFGEERASSVYTVSFERETSSPETTLTFRYNDREGLHALGIDVDGRWSSVEHERRMRESAEPFRRNASYAQPPPGWRR